MRITIIIFTILLVITSACNDDQTREKKEFPKHLSLVAQKHKIEEVIKPVNINIHNDFLIIQIDRIPESSCFYVYSLDSLEYLYSFGKLGGGDDEFVAPLICRDNGSDLFHVFDQRVRNLRSYKITDKGAFLQDAIKVSEPSGYPLQEAVMSNDSILLYLTIDNYLVSYNVNTENTIDSISFETGLRDVLGEQYNQSMDFFHLSTYDGQIVMGHNFIDKLSLNKCSNSGKFIEAPSSLKKFLHYTYSNELYENLYRYVYLYSTSDLIFAQYSGYKFKALQPFPVNIWKRHFDFLMEVYDWDLKPKALLEFDNDFLRCVVDEKKKRG